MGVHVARSIKSEGTGAVQHFSHYKSMGMFQEAQVQLTHKSLNIELTQAFMVVLVTLNNEEDPIKM